jgi:hypothetical protein
LVHGLAGWMRSNERRGFGSLNQPVEDRALALPMSPARKAEARWQRNKHLLRARRGPGPLVPGTRGTCARAKYGLGRG